MNQNPARQLIDSLLHPAREFSPMPFWFLNDDLHDDEIVRQLHSFNEKGVHGVVLHPRIGIPETIEYLSDRFMHAIRTAVETAHRLDMKIILYDEAMYPSGSAHGMVVRENPRFAAQAITLSDTPDGGKVIAETAGGQYILQVNSGGTIRGIHFGEDDGQPNAPAAADLLCPEAVETFIRLTHERYYSCLAPYFGNTVIGFFTDEPSLLGRGAKRGVHAWTWGLETILTERGVCLADLSGLFTGEENESTRIYHETLFEMENDIYYRRLFTWCEHHGIALMGHPHRGDDIESERFVHVPGQDVVLRWVAPEQGSMEGYESVQAKCSADAARCLGRRRNSNECFGACCRDKIKWNFSGADMKWYIDWLGVRGVNLYIPHAFYYSVTEKRKDERPPDVGPNNIWWPYYERISTYMKRICALMTDSVNCAEVCFLCENRRMQVEEAVPFYESQTEFNYVPYRLIPEDAVRDGELRIGGNTYRYILGDTERRFPMLTAVTGPEAIAVRAVYTDTPIPALRAAHIRKKNGADAFFLTNEGEETICTEAEIDGRGALLAMDLFRGTVRNLSCEQRGARLRFSLTLPRRESLLLVPDPEGTAGPVPTAEPRYIEPDFTEIETDPAHFTKTYEAAVTVGDPSDLRLRFRAEEMAECFVNGDFVDVSFWNEHDFDLSRHLHAGENTIRIRVTGSAVNRFTDQRIPYGMMP